MFLMRRFILAAILTSAMFSAHAGKDPIGWTLSGSLPATANLNHSYAVSFTIKSNLSFPMPSPLKISNNSTPAAEVTMVDACSGLKLTPGQTCTVGLVLTPKSAGKKFLSVFMEYGKNKVMIPRTPLTTTTPDGINSLLTATDVGFPPNGILTSTTYNLSFTFKNVSASPITGLALAPNAGNSAGFAQGSVTNCGSALNAGDSCVVTGSFDTSATSGSVSVGYTYASSSISAVATTSSVISSSAYPVRTITFINKCSQSVWFGAVGGNVTYNGCKTDSQCPNGSYCNPTAVGNGFTGGCFYSSLPPANGNYQLATSGPSSTNTVTIVDYGLQYPWNGNVAGRTLCSSTFCQTGDCGNGQGGCPIGVSFSQPVTLGEITMLRNSGADSYDVSILNGTNVPMQMMPTTTGTFNPNSAALSEFSCTSPGSKSSSGTSPNDLAACPWTFTPPSPAYKYTYVNPTLPKYGIGCIDNSPCTGSDVCGLYYDRQASPTTLNSYCGSVIGYNTQNQVCSFKNTNASSTNSANNPGDAYFPCDTALPSNPAALTPYTFWAMYACKPQSGNVLGTCYDSNSNPPNSCCGCTNWSDAPSPVHVPANILQCPVSYTDPTWTSDVLPGINFMKTGCPTAYAYPFDDQSVSFNCSDAASLGAGTDYNKVDYTVTFCPT
jgi:hypothetical protein